MTIIIIRKGKAVTAPPTPKKEPPPSGPLMDSTIRYLIEQWPNLLIAYYLICSYLYYVRDISIVTDAFYDEICETLYVHWDDVEHMHKHLIERDALRAGTGYYIPREKYPGMTRAAACHLVNASWNTHLRADP